MKSIDYPSGQTDASPQHPLADSIWKSLRQSPELPALEFEEKWYSWGWLREQVQNLDHALTEAGAPERARIGIVVRNRPMHLAALFGVLATKRCAVLISAFQSAEKSAAEIARLELAAVVADRQEFEVQEFVTGVRDAGCAGIVLNREDMAVWPGLARGAIPSRISFGVALEMPTSGTTGEPKRIPFSEAGLFDSIVDFARIAAEMGELAASNKPEATLVQYAPILHIGGLDVALQMGVEGRRMVLLEKFTAAGWHRAVRLYRPTVTGMPPAMIRIVLDSSVPAEDVESVRAVRSGAAALDDATQKQLEDRFGIVPLRVYGATEYIGIVASWSLESHAAHGFAKKGSVGKIRRHVADARVVDRETGKPLAPNEVGLLELLVPRASGDWMRTSDLASVDNDDFLYIYGRADNTINRGGFKVLLDKVADALRGHPEVFDVAVIGIPDERLGEVPAAAIERRRGCAGPTTAELEALARRHLSNYERPATYVVVDRLPRTPAEKVILPEVRKMFPRRTTTT